MKTCPLCKGGQASLNLGTPKRGNIKAAILALIKTVGADGITAEEISRALAVPAHVVAARVCELHNRGDVRVAGSRVNVSGKRAQVYAAVPAPVAAADDGVSQACHDAFGAVLA